MRRELAWNFGIVAILVMVGIYIVACASRNPNQASENIPHLPAFQDAKAERDPYNAPRFVTVTNPEVPVPPTPPGVASPAVVATVRKVLSVAQPSVSQPAPKSMGLALYVPFNGATDAGRWWLLLQSSTDMQTWRTIGSNEQVSGHMVTNNVTWSNQSQMFFRTIAN